MKTIILNSLSADDLVQRLDVLCEVGIDPNGDYSTLRNALRDHSVLCIMLEADISPVQRRQRKLALDPDDRPPWN